MKKVLTIAGSDCSGGAGIQADIKTISAHDMYAMSVITSLTAQNTTGVYGIMDISAEFVAKQIDCVFTDIIPNSVKVGMVSNAEIINVVAENLKQYHVENLIVDTVMISTSGNRLLSENAVTALREKLMPLATVITPNLPEAECLCGFNIKCREDMLKAGRKILGDINGSVLIKGGHLTDSADDLLCTNDGGEYWFEIKRIDNPNTHGTGCTLSSAIACGLAEGKGLYDSVKDAKKYVTLALDAQLNLGKGNGPLYHNVL